MYKSVAVAGLLAVASAQPTFFGRVQTVGEKVESGLPTVFPALVNGLPTVVPAITNGLGYGTQKLAQGVQFAALNPVNTVNSALVNGVDYGTIPTGIPTLSSLAQYVPTALPSFTDVSQGFQNRAQAEATAFEGLSSLTPTAFPTFSSFEVPTGLPNFSLTSEIPKSVNLLQPSAVLTGNTALLTVPTLLSVPGTALNLDTQNVALTSDGLTNLVQNTLTNTVQYVAPVQLVKQIQQLP